MMRYFTINLISFAVFALVVALLAVKKYEPKPTYYNNSAVVIDIEADDTVVVKDPTGNIWAFNLPDATRFSLGDKVTMIMSDNGSADEITDDIVVWVD